jgi:glutaredoxin 3
MTYHIITKDGCAHCTRAKAMLDIRGLAYTIDHRRTPAELQAFVAEGYRTFPQVFENGRHIGGADQLAEHLANLVEADF